MNNPIGIGILGCGNVAQVHAAAIARIPSLRLTSVCSSSRDSAARLAAAHGVAAHTDLETFLKDLSASLKSGDEDSEKWLDLARHLQAEILDCPS